MQRIPFTMDQQTFLEIATVVSKLKMYPYFDVASHILMCLVVRDDNPPSSGKVHWCQVFVFLLRSGHLSW